jgi:L-malate glycosyltransferase
VRILYFSRSYTTHDRRFLEALAASSLQVWFLQLEPAAGYETRALPPGVHVAAWPRGFQPADSVEARLALMPDFERVLADVRPDIVHAGPVQSCGFMTALSGTRPFLAASWGSDILVDADRNAAWSWMTAYTLRHADMLLCDCDAVRHKVQQILPYPDDRIVQFPWGIDLQQFAPGPDTLNLRESLGWHDAFVALTTRSWEEIYGHHVLLEAFQIAHARNPRLRLILLGDGSLAGPILEFIRAQGLEEVIHRPGRVPYEGIAQYMRAADLYVSASQSDGTSISLLEAMATGLPVLVSDLPGNREWVHPPANGWLTPNEPRVFGETWLAAASSDAGRRAATAASNRAVAVRRADWSTNVKRLFAAYERLAPAAAASAFRSRHV